MTKICCLNPISKKGLSRLSDGFEITENLSDADAVLVRSAAMHDLELPGQLVAIARAGAGVNNLPLDTCTEKGRTKETKTSPRPWRRAKSSLQELRSREKRLA